MDVMELVSKLMIAETERDDLLFENAILSADLDDALSHTESLREMLRRSMNNYECWNCGTRYARFQTEEQTCPACQKEPRDYRAELGVAKKQIKDLEAALKRVNDIAEKGVKVIEYADIGDEVDGSEFLGRIATVVQPVLRALESEG
jgi:hypothetical protein